MNETRHAGFEQEKAEAVSPNLVATLVHPERKANVSSVRFSPDGQRLFIAGYPSGIVQIWDVAARKELRRINSPAGFRGSANYALLTPDWKTLYIPVETRKVVRGEKEGKPFVRIEQGGGLFKRSHSAAHGKGHKNL